MTNTHENLALVRLPGEGIDRIQVFKASTSINTASLDFFHQHPSQPIFICSAWNDTQNVWLWSEYVGQFHLEEMLTWPINFNFRRQAFRSTSPEKYQQMLSDALHALEHTSLEKVVLAREKVEDYPSDSSNLLRLFTRLCEHNPNAFVYVCSSMQWGTWMGASPEILLSYEQEQVTVMSLAGTLFNAHETWSEKERSEQSVTSNFIESCLDWGSSDAVIIEELQQGSLRHLMSIYRKYWSKDRLGELLQRLSPTPAVAGFPKETALNFIAEKEDINRDLYAGFIGIHSAESTQLHVNLRCAEFGLDRIRMIAGGGINAKSKVEREWQETELKMRVIGECLS